MSKFKKQTKQKGAKMKKLIFILSTILLFSFLNPSDGFAQPKQKLYGKNFKENMTEKLNLSKEQQDKISELRAKHQKEMIDLKAELQKKMIDKRELRNSDFTRAELLSSVKEINEIKNKIAIARANHQMDIYELLTPEQRKIWQVHKPMRDHMRMKFNHKRFEHDGFGRGQFGPPDFDD